jgi:hypothetical protein
MITDSIATFRAYPGVKIFYGDNCDEPGAYHIQSTSLLFEKGIRSIEVEVNLSGEMPGLFPSRGDHPFDILAALFFLVTRYEEYISGDRDAYGRFDHRFSVAFRHGFLDRPLINEWLFSMRDRLAKKFPGEKWLSPASFEILPTYDIDEAWSYRHKKSLINLGGMVKDLAKGRIKRVRERWKVRRGDASDPFDAYRWMDALHEKHDLNPHYFFLLAERRGRYDRNIHPSVQALQELIMRHAEKYAVGIHPSWQSIEPGILLKEIATLEKITGKKITASRQHYIRFSLPSTYRHLIGAGIDQEFSMGYGSANGFRASICSPFNWYDLEKEQETSLLVYPFCFMDANSFFEARQRPEEAIREMRSFYERVKKVNGCFISIWHNTFLGTDPLFEGWRDAYAGFWEKV